MQCDHGPQNGDVETGSFLPQSDMTNISSFTTIRPPTSITGMIGDSATNYGQEKRNYSWWNHFFDHFLDGSAGVMYTSFLGLILLMRLSTLVQDLLPSIDFLEMVHGTFCRSGIRSNDTIVNGFQHYSSCRKHHGNMKVKMGNANIK